MTLDQVREALADMGSRANHYPDTHPTMILVLRELVDRVEALEVAAKSKGGEE